MNLHQSVRDYLSDNELTGDLSEAYSEGSVTVYIGVERHTSPASIIHAINTESGEIVDIDKTKRVITATIPLGLLEDFANRDKIDSIQPATDENSVNRYSAFVADPISRSTDSFSLNQTVDLLDGLVYHLQNTTKSGEVGRELSAARMYADRLTSHFGFDEHTSARYLNVAFDENKWLTLVLSYDAELYRGNLALEPRKAQGTSTRKLRSYLKSYPYQSTIQLSIRVKETTTELVASMSGTADPARIQRKTPKEQTE